MDFAVSFKKFLIVVLAGLALTACATQKKQTGQMQSDVYTGTDTVEYLATGVRDRVFFCNQQRWKLLQDRSDGDADETDETE